MKEEEASEEEPADGGDKKGEEGEREKPNGRSVVWKSVPPGDKCLDVLSPRPISDKTRLPIKTSRRLITAVGRS